MSGLGASAARAQQARGSPACMTRFASRERAIRFGERASDVRAASSGVHASVRPWRRRARPPSRRRHRSLSSRTRSSTCPRTRRGTWSSTIAQE
eukprot:1289593-Pleurochrysis_carterae.AAC.1